MGNEAGKAFGRLEPLMVGRGIDIGCGDSPVGNAEPWDLVQGDAQYMAGVPDLSFDWVFSSHCLEHIKDPHTALQNWWRILKPKGHLIVLVPDEDLYEQGKWPSTHNGDHKHTFTPGKYNSWSPVSVNCTDMIRFLPGHKLISITTEDHGYDYSKQDVDQTSGPAEASVQIILKKEYIQLFEIPVDIEFGGIKYVSP